jgi:single-strand DNA-binding protein
MAEKFTVDAIGRLTRDPELRYLPNGTALAEFGLVTSKDWKNKNTDEWVKNPLYSNWQAWGDNAELVVKSLHKGQKVNLKGEYSTQSWDDKNTGEKKTSHKFKLTSFSVEENTTAQTKQEVSPIIEEIEEDLPF